MSWRLYMTTQPFAEARARAMTLRPDMREQFEAAGGIPSGPIWTLMHGDRVVGMGGLKPLGAATSGGWLLVADDVSARDWVQGRQAIRQVMEWAATRSIRRVRALVDAGNPGARRLLVRLGFEATGRDGDEITMTRELI